MLINCTKSIFSVRPQLERSGISKFPLKKIGKCIVADPIWEGDYENHSHRLYVCLVCKKPVITCDSSCKLDYSLNHKDLNYLPSTNLLTLLTDIYRISNAEKSCKCSPQKINCLDEAHWQKKQYGVVQFKYSASDYSAKKIHPAVNPLELPTFFIELLTHKGELVLDPFGGSGTTVESSLRLERKVISIDLSKVYTEYAEKRNGKLENYSQALIICGDSKSIVNLLKDKSIKLIYTSPPYANLLNKTITHRSRINRDRDTSRRNYSNSPDDLGNLEINIFLEKLREIFETLHAKLVDNGHVVINICNDIYDKSTNQLIPFPAKIVTFMKDIGYSYKNKWIWDRSNFFSHAHIFGYPSNVLIYSGSYELILHFEKN